MKETMRRMVAAILIAALCTVMCQCIRDEVPAKAASAESAEPAVNKWVPSASWEREEVVAELDENNKDENGYTYELKKEGSSYTADFTVINVTQCQNAKEDIVIRVPDVVIKDGENYTVTGFTPKPNENNYNLKIRKKFKIYIGKNISYIIDAPFHYKMSYDVNQWNPNFKVEDGHLFSKDGSQFLRFNDDAYGPDQVYILPDTVKELGYYAFYEANIKEVVLNDKITSIPDNIFYGSTLQRIDLKNAREIGGYAFYFCGALREVKINCENVQIGQHCFAYSGLENIYLPPGASIHAFSPFSGCRRLKTVIMGDGVQISDEYTQQNLFNGDYQLKTFIFSNNISSISSYMLAWCSSLRKLYIPDSIQSIEERGLQTAGELTLYGKKGSVAEQYDDDNITFVDISEHKHSMKEMTFFEYDSWGVKGKYCEECAYGTDFEIVNYDEEDKKEQMPEHLEIPDKCPEVLKLDNKNRDEQGLIYELDKETKTAMVQGVDETNPFPRYYFALPETVEKNGTTYVLNAIGEYALWSADIVFISDTVKRVCERAFGCISGKIVLGKNVQTMDKSAFRTSGAQVEVPDSNPNFKKIGNVLYSGDGKEIIKYCDEDCIEKEFCIPTKIKHVWDGAFYGNSHLYEIYVYDCGKLTMGNQVFDQCGAEIIYGNGYTWYDDEDYIVELNSQNVDADGWGYSLDGGTLTAELGANNGMLIPDDVSGEFEIRIPDKVRKDGRLYTVTHAYPSFYSNVTVPDHFYIRLYFGKYLEIGGRYNFLKVAYYVHAENKYNASEQGSLIRKQGNSYTELVQFCDKSCDPDGSYTVPDGIYAIDTAAFADTKIKSVNINDVKVINQNAFGHCPDLEEVVIREGVELRWAAFSDCPKLNYLYLPPNSKLGAGALKSSSLKIVVIDESTRMDEASECFSDCESLWALILPENVPELLDKSFYRCSSLKRLYIPSSVVRTGQDCFSGMTGKIYVDENSEIKEETDWTVHLVSRKDHTHDLSQVTFFAFDTWAVTGSYCRECAYGTDCRRVELADESDRENLPPILTRKGTSPSSVPMGVPTTDTPTPTEPIAEQAPELSVPIVQTVQGHDLLSDDAGILATMRTNLLVKGFRISTKDNRSVTLRWQTNVAAKCYRIYRAERKNGTYKVLQTVGISKKSFTDKKVDPRKRYYYKVTALDYYNGKAVEGSSAIRSIRVTGIITPKIALKKGRLKSVPYVMVILKKYQGKYANIKIPFDGKKYKKLKLYSEKISKYKGRFKIRYAVKKKTIYFKVRTYQKEGKKKRYSNFSDVSKVKV